MSLGEPLTLVSQRAAEALAVMPVHRGMLASVRDAARERRRQLSEGPGDAAQAEAVLRCAVAAIRAVEDLELACDGWRP